MHYMLQCNILLLLTYAPTIGSFDTACKEISQGKSFCMEKSSLAQDALYLYPYGNSGRQKFSYTTVG